jgi:two-component system chemotaxis response regulator CheB
VIIPLFDPGRFGVVAIGSSTGGPNLVRHIVTGLPADLPIPIIVAQHLPPTFTESFANQLAHESPLAVYHADDGMPVVGGAVYIGRGHKHMRVVRDGPTIRLAIRDEPRELLYKPAADELFASCADVFASRTLAIVMTGIGKDGLVGARRVHARGGVVLTQSRATCAVYGMPRACDEAGLSSASLTPEELRQVVLQLAPSVAAARI